MVAGVVVVVWYVGVSYIVRMWFSKKEAHPKWTQEDYIIHIYSYKKVVQKVLKNKDT